MAMRPDRMSAVLRDGVLSGLVAGLCVLAVFAVYDVFTTEIMRTPSVLHAHFFDGLEAAMSVETDLARAVPYTFLHFALWIGAGICAAYVAAFRKIFPALWYAVVTGPSVILCVFIWVAGVWGVPGLGVHHFWVGALLGGVAMAAIILWRQPSLAGYLDD